MAKKDKPQKSPLLNENTVRRFMRLANIQQLSEGFVADLAETEELDEEIGQETEEEIVPEEVVSEEEMMDDDEGGSAEISPEAAQAIVDLAASLEASGALEDDAEDDMEDADDNMEDADDDMEDADEDIEDADDDMDELEEELSGLGIEIVDDQNLQEQVRKRVIARLLKEKKAQEKAELVDNLVNKIFDRLK